MVIGMSRDLYIQLRLRFFHSRFPLSLHIKYPGLCHHTVVPPVLKCMCHLATWDPRRSALLLQLGLPALIILSTGLQFLTTTLPVFLNISWQATEKILEPNQLRVYLHTLWRSLILWVLFSSYWYRKSLQKGTWEMKWLKSGSSCQSRLIWIANTSLSTWRALYLLLVMSNNA